MGNSVNDYPVICFGESAWLASPAGSRADGYPVNIACHLKILGLNPAIITRVGLDEEGKRLIGFMEDRQIATDFFQIDYDALTGSASANDPASTSFHPGQQPQAWDHISWDPGFDQLLAAARFFVHGTLPARSSGSRHTLYQFMDTGIQRVFDINLRTPFYNKRLIQDCLTGSFVVKLNTDELELITGWFSSFSSSEERIQALQDRFGIPYIILSRGFQGCLINAAGSLIDHPGFGNEEPGAPLCEEAFIAGLLFQFLQNESPAKVASYAAALRALAASAGTHAYQPEQISKIMYK